MTKAGRKTGQNKTFGKTQDRHGTKMYGGTLQKWKCLFGYCVSLSFSSNELISCQTKKEFFGAAILLVDEVLSRHS